ncbi:MAG: MarR family winged helix-turn-helix transcriptional regulator [Hyphomicrobiaceae bacterium]|nr:MarR family winged helix-turn-helix transcriptional regulator [Hyphomicrobiaceae bacterium]
MPTDPLPPCTLYRLRMATRKATRAYDRHFAAIGLTSPQYGLLMTIAARPGQPVGAIAQRLDMDRTTLTRNLKPLTARGLVTTEGSDKRSRALRLTPAGETTLGHARTAWRAAQAEVAQHFGTHDTDALHTLLASFVDKLPSS